jgi:hypothetical protein
VSVSTQYILQATYDLHGYRCSKRGQPQINNIAATNIIMLVYANGQHSAPKIQDTCPALAAALQCGSSETLLLGHAPGRRCRRMLQTHHCPPAATQKYTPAPASIMQLTSGIVLGMLYDAKESTDCTLQHQQALQRQPHSHQARAAAGSAGPARKASPWRPPWSGR